VCGIKILNGFEVKIIKTKEAGNIVFPNISPLFMTNSLSNL
jgi:hypothetical protein